MLSEVDLCHLRRAIHLARMAREHGNHPFGALLVGPSRVVYALPGERLDELSGDDPAGKPSKLSCREVFARWAHAIEIAGPALEAEAEEPHRGFWRDP